VVLLISLAAICFILGMGIGALLVVILDSYTRIDKFPLRGLDDDG
jgi:hypothetical protein